MVSLFLTLALCGGEWSASCLGYFIPKERTSSTHFIGGWVGPLDSLDTYLLTHGAERFLRSCQLCSLDTVKRKIPCVFQESNTGHPACSLSLYGLSCPHHNYNQYICVLLYIGMAIDLLG
jgi:hypothetical protein